MTDLPNHIKEIYANAKQLYTQSEINSALDKMATAMNAQLADTNPIFLCLVVGGIVALGNLLPRLNFPLEVDYIHVTRYRGNTQGSNIEWRKELTRSLQNRTVVIVDDILDGGLTLAETVKYCQDKGAKQIYTAVLVDKKCQRENAGIIRADFTGLEVDNYYVFGYGMDYKEYLRNAPGIFAVSEK